MYSLKQLSHFNSSTSNGKKLKRLTKFVIIPATMIATGCAHNQAPVVDLNGVSQQQYQQDLAYCEQFALQVDKGEAARVGMANGAAVGAGTGAVAGALEDGIGGAVVGSLVGAVLGGASGNVQNRIEATDDQARVLRNCLVDKGYKVYDREI